MSQTGTQQNADETIEEEWIEQLVLDLLFFIQSLNHEVGQHQTYQPAK
jgi:hypothetical protein